MSRTPRNNDNPQVTRTLVGRGAFEDDPLFVVDVGASGGIDGYWREFDDQLRAVGFDPLITEVDRLNASADPGVHYEAAWVTCREPGTTSGTPSTQFFQRTSAVRAAEIAELDYAREHYNAGAPVELSDMRIVLDERFERDERQRIDFLKVDTDGGDFDVLRGAEEILRDGGVLGLAVEVQFHGPVTPDANLFSNIDRYLRGFGFGLFDLEVNRYSRGALPAQFALDIPAQTITGQASWAEAIYFRDLGDPAYDSMWTFRPSRIDVLKLVCLFEIFGLPDCSAELILKYGDGVGDEQTRTRYLDILASEQSGFETTYVELQRRFALDARQRFSSTP